MTFAYVEEFEREAERMVSESMTDAQFWAMVGGVFGKADEDASTRAKNAQRERDARLGHLWHVAPTQESIRGTRFLPDL